MQVPTLPARHPPPHPPRFHAPNRELLTASTNGTLVAAGAGDAVLFWDRRKAQPLASFGDTHAQVLTQITAWPGAVAGGGPLRDEFMPGARGGQLVS